jgi:FMN reductase
MASEYLVVSGSRKPQSRSRILASYLLDYYQTNALEAEILDLREFDLPFCDGATAYGNPEAIRCNQIVAAARVIVVAAPIYNYDLSATVKNLIELTGQSWESKIVGFACAAGGYTSYMSVMAFANSLMLDFRCLVIPRFVFATGEDFDNGQLVSEEVKRRLLELGEMSTRVRYA